MTLEEAKEKLTELQQKLSAYAHATSLIYYDGVMYMITEFHRAYEDNIIQIKAQETQEKLVRYVAPTTEPTTEPTSNVGTNDET